MEKNNSHRLIAEERGLLEITGVRDVVNYNESEIELQTTNGNLTVCGSDFNIIKLDVESGEMKIKGCITSLYYTDNDEEKSVGILRRLFR